MQERLVGRTGLRVSRLGLGTGSWGRDTDEHEARDQLVAFVEAGGSLLDTASSYGAEVSERVIAPLIGDVVARDDIVLASKAGFGTRGTGPDVSRRAMLRSLDQSLVRLGVSHLDLWQVHAWSDLVPLDETLGALDQAVASGKARYAGVSDYTGWQTALAYARAGGAGAIASTQVEYSLLNRSVEREVVPAARALGMGVLAWAPLGRGVLTGKYRTGVPSDSRGASAHLAGFVEPYLQPASRRIVEGVARAADGLGVSPVEVALAWVRDRPGVAAALVGARTAAQLKGSLSSDDVELPHEIVTALDDVSREAV